ERIGQKFAKDAGCGHHANGWRRVFRLKQLSQFCATPLVVYLGVAALFSNRSLHCRGIDIASSVPRMKPEETQDAKIIFADARDRVTDKADTAGFQITNTAE